MSEVSQSTSQRTVLTDDTGATASVGGFDLRSWQGLTAVLKAAREGGLSDSAYAAFRDLVLQYAQQGGDAAFRKKIEDTILTFRAKREVSAAPESSVQATTKDVHTSKFGSRRAEPKFSFNPVSVKAIVTPQAPVRAPLKRIVPVTISDTPKPVVPSIPPTPASTIVPPAPPKVAEIASPAPQVPTPPASPKPDPVLNVVSDTASSGIARKAISVEPAVAQVPTPPASLATDPVLNVISDPVPVAMASEAATQAAVTQVPPPAVAVPQPEVVTPPVPVPAPAPVALPTKSMDEYKARIAEIKRTVNARVGNPVTLIDAQNQIGRTYMNALLAAMKATGPSATVRIEDAMASLEETYHNVEEYLSANPIGLAQKKAPVTEVVGSSPKVPTAQVGLKSVVPPVKLPTQTSGPSASPVPQRTVSESSVAMKQSEPARPPVAQRPQSAIPSLLDLEKEAEETIAALPVKKPVETGKKAFEPVVPSAAPAPAPAPKPLPPVVELPRHAETASVRVMPHAPADTGSAAPQKTHVPEVVMETPHVVSVPMPKDPAPTPVPERIASVPAAQAAPAISTPLASTASRVPVSRAVPSAPTDTSHVGGFGAASHVEVSPVQERPVVQAAPAAPRPVVTHQAAPRVQTGPVTSIGEAALQALKAAEMEAVQAHSPQAQTELASSEVTESLNKLLHEWKIFASSGLFGIGPGGFDHPLYATLSKLSMGEVIAGRWERSDPEVLHTIKDYIDAWRHEQGIAYNPTETFEHYLRRVVLRILKRQKGEVTSL